MKLHKGISSPSLCFLSAFVFILMAGCGTQAPPQRTPGSLVVCIDADGVRARTIVPAVTMEIAAYDVQGTGPEAATFGGTGLGGDSRQWDDLVPGQWIVTVNARNPDGIVIATATETAVVVGGESTELDMTVVPLTGPGTLSVLVSWPGSLIDAPVVSGSLAPEGGSPVVLELTMASESASWCSPDLEAGYYRLSLQIRDGSTLVWGRVEAVRILAGQAASAVYPLADADMNGAPAAGIALHVSADLGNPSAITLTGLQPLLPLQSVMTVTAHAPATPESWQWYLNGEPITGGTLDTITAGGGLPAGRYWLDVTARKGSVLSSGHGFFTISSQRPAMTPAAGEIVINEIMMDPAGVADTSGEWFELCNITSRPLDLQGLAIRTASQFVRLAATGGVIVQPGAFLVLCRNGDPAVNGQVAAGYTYGSGISLPNSGGSLTVAQFGTNGMDGAVIDTVQWTASTSGKSLSLKSQFRNAIDNDVAANWYWSGKPYSSTDMGTPGSANE